MDIKDRIKEIQQSRSGYQIEKFVIGQHHSPEMQYYQLCLETNAVIQNIEETELNIKKIEAEIEELLNTGKKSDAIEAEIKKLSISNMQISLIGNKRELEFLKKLFEKYPEYTRDEIESAQSDYWETRLIRVAQMQMLSRQGGVDWAQLDAIWQTGIIDKAIMEIPTMNKFLTNVELVELPMDNG